jgi:hypothetical protein
LLGAPEHQHLLADVEARRLDPYAAADQILGPLGA